MSSQYAGYDDGELEISLSTSVSANRKQPPPEARRDNQEDEPKPHQSILSGPDPPPQKTEQRIGAYQIIRTLGEGSFGKVKLAVHNTTGQQVALKIIARKKLISRDMAGRVEREIEYLQLLRHPHIIKLFTVIKTPVEIIMVLEYAGGELFDYIVNNGKMREDEARRFFQQIICAVEYCHRHKIVHRDLKPENLLLDTDLNVKIADFGLSNIMTDGNFLKTSCGSPNYAAPEVINGKLYAGPEVDVWSCGVILYVLLVGRLPFDDEHIPSLFAKIAKGQYVVPSYLSTGSATLISKMLQTNPINRISINEIRMDPWFVKNLAPYLRPAVEEFIDTGVDPNKAINPKNIAPHATPAVAMMLHDQVTEKISQTMGYGIQDVREALEADEPSAIKDAYMIVKENKMMQQNTHLADEKGQLLFQAPSPPPWNGDAAPGLTTPISPSPLGASDRFDPPAIPSSLINHMSPRSASLTGNDRSDRPYISKIGILPSSLPAYHRVYWEAHKSGKTVGDALSTTHAEDTEPHPQTDAEKAETRSRLNPHSKGSQVKLAESTKPASMTQLPRKKERPIKWQFGIRSRNQPLEAIGCIYKALKTLGAEWRIDDDDDELTTDMDDMAFDDRNSNHSSQDSSDHALHHSSSMNNDTAHNKPVFKQRGDGHYNVPKDPWVIHVRWKEGGLLPPGHVPPGSRHASAVDLRRQSITSLSSAGSSLPSQEVNPPPLKQIDGSSADAVYMHLDIQVYEMERSVYLVDFKCAGYENSDGCMLEEKDVTSPFPFLDMASKLIIALAEAD